MSRSEQEPRAIKQNNIYFCPYCNRDLKRVESTTTDYMLLCLSCGYTDSVTPNLTEDQFKQSQKTTKLLSPLERVYADQSYELRDDSSQDLLVNSLTKNKQFDKPPISNQTSKLTEKGILHNYDNRSASVKTDKYLKGSTLNNKEDTTTKKGTIDQDHEKDVEELRKKGYKILHEY